MNPIHKLLPILSDQPAAQDRLNFGPYAKTLAEIVADPDTDTPLTIGVFGSWGQGKTSLLSMVERRLEALTQPAFALHTVWFNAWLYSREDALWRALIARVLQGARAFDLDPATRADLHQLEGRLYGLAEPGGGELALPAGLLPPEAHASLPTRMGLEVLRRQLHRAGEDEERLRELEALIADVEESYALTRRDRLVALDDFRRHFECLSRRCIAPRGRLTIFIDDLDRCLPEKAVEVLEAIKLFLDVPGFVFMLGVDRAVIEEGIRVRYAGHKSRLSGANYLEKIIQIPFSLPPIASNAVETYIREETAGNLPDERCETVFSVGLEPNPRRIKRTLNVFLLLWRLSQNRETLRDAIKPVRLAKIVIIQQYHPRLFALLTQGPHYLIDLERRFRAVGDARADQQALHLGREFEALQTQEISAGPLTEFLNKPLLHQLLTCTAPDRPDANFIDLTPAGVREYIYLTRSAVEEESVTEAAAQLPIEPQLVTIPAGPFLMGTAEAELDEIAAMGVDRDWVKNELPQHEVTLPAFAISRYAVTNAEFANFVEDGGYTTSAYWSEAGWQQKTAELWSQPRYWEDEKWNHPSQPVVGVSWYEATAYCRWLSAKTGREYRLPTEAEWEKAARGTDGRRYPWGNSWDPARCNNKEGGPGKTTEVGEYPQGDSPFNVGEMVGQIWEWCSTQYAAYPYEPRDGRENGEREEVRVLRGGSWYDSDPEGVCRCAFRLWNGPRLRGSSGGFRCARPLPAS